MTIRAKNHRVRVICPVCKREVSGCNPDATLTAKGLPPGDQYRPMRHLDQRPGVPKGTVCEGRNQTTDHVVEM